MCQLTPNRDVELTLATLWHPLEAPDMCLFPMLILGSLFATNHGTTGPHLFLRQALRLKKTAEHPTDEGTRAGPFRAGISRAPPMAESEGFSNFGIESKFLSPVPWPQWGEGFWVLMVGGCFLEGELQGEVFEAMEMIFSFLVGLIQIFCEVIFVHVYILLVTSKMQV